MTEFLSQRQFHEIAGRGTAAGAAVERLGRVVRAPDDGSRVVSFCFSDGSVDRMGDVINPQGWDTAAFKRNPVCLWAHDATAPPIGKVRRTYVSGDRFVGDIEFAAPETYEFADTIYRLVQEKFINAVSVGFMPIEWSWSEDKSRPGGIDFERCELLEISVVPIPANANALIEARATKSWGRSYARTAARSAPVPTPLSYAGTAAMRQAAFSHDHPDSSETARTEAQIRTITRIGPSNTAAGRRQWIEALWRLHKRVSR
jgi:HK97 family phage prohead protease